MNKKIVLTVVAAFLGTGAMAQSAKPAQPEKAAPPAKAAQPVAPADAPEPAISPEAMEALKKMGAFLRAQQAFQVLAKVTTDEVLPNGQKVELASDVDLKVKKPNRLTALSTSDRKHRQIRRSLSTARGSATTRRSRPRRRCASWSSC
ncbi:MAG: Protein of unknown function periplasmic [Myxococcaceae bacterium]|nr:Protein of unknown function periplasmic [Myxococcaceae bacterium]